MAIDYNKPIIKEAIGDLKKHGVALVFNEEQLEEIRKVVNIKITRRDKVGFYIRMVKQ